MPPPGIDVEEVGKEQIDIGGKIGGRRPETSDKTASKSSAASSAPTSDGLNVCESIASAQLVLEADGADVIGGQLELWHEVALDKPEERDARAAEEGTVLASGVGTEDPGTAPRAFPPAFQRWLQFT